MSEPADNPNPPTLADRLGDVTVGLRVELEVSRHIFRGQPSYVVRDPMTFQSQKLDAADYQVLVSISHDRRLADIFDDLVARDVLAPPDEDKFYDFIMSLHRLGFLQLPIADYKNLYRRYRSRERATRRSRITGFLFLRIPLLNPDNFLNRTMHLARPLFTKTAFVVWCLVMLAAGFVALKNRHAYACKRFGGHVPEMGAYMILFTPCAYVDATASWGFTRKRDRILVCLGGMYVESFIAALAVFVWAMAGSAMVQGIAYNVIFLASVVTVLFNVNPLMRYDGYYLFSDLVEIPNLRARASEYVSGLIKRVALGVSVRKAVRTSRLRAILFTYGIAASIYRVMLVVGISILLASKVFILGMAMAIFFLGGAVINMIRNIASYVLHSEETAPVRGRAVAVTVATIALAAVGLLYIPLPTSVDAQGLVQYEREHVVRTTIAGSMTSRSVRDGQAVRKDQILAELEDDTATEGVAIAEANLRVSMIRQSSYLADQPELASQERDRSAFHRFAVAEARKKISELTVASPIDGTVIGCVEQSAVERFIPQGTPIATIGSGRWLVKTIVSASDMRLTRPAEGDRVTFRLAAAADRDLGGEVVRVAPAASRRVELLSLTQLAGGEVAVDPGSQHATKPYFEVVIALDATGDTPIRSGATGTVRLIGAAEPLLPSLTRRLARFFNKLMLD